MSSGFTISSIFALIVFSSFAVFLIIFVLLSLAFGVNPPARVIDFNTVSPLVILYAPGIFHLTVHINKCRFRHVNAVAVHNRQIRRNIALFKKSLQVHDDSDVAGSIFLRTPPAGSSALLLHSA